ncbi:MAG: SgcJ/EcaC family oxidoreductase [Gemmatimonadaceae bacterium]
MIRIKGGLAVSAGIILIAACNAADKSADTATATIPAAVSAAADDSAIRAINKTWFASHNAGDAAGVAAMYADDAVVMAPGSPMARGGSAIKALFDSEIGAMTQAGLTETQGTGDFSVSGDMGWESNTYAVVDKAGKTVETGKYLTVFAKKDGKWSIIRDTWNSDAPLPKS